MREKLAVDMETGNALKAVAVELARAEKLHPIWPADLFRQNSVLQEEASEVTKAVNDHEYKNAPLEDIKTEVIQTAAMCIRFLKAIEKMERRAKA